METFKSRLRPEEQKIQNSCDIGRTFQQPNRESEYVRWSSILSVRYIVPFLSFQFVRRSIQEPPALRCSAQIVMSANTGL